MAGNRTDRPQPGHSPPARRQLEPAPGREEQDPGPEEPAPGPEEQDPGPEEQDPGPEEQDPGPEEQRGEHCGPLAIARRRKGDGRALILYTREERRRT
jgi:hypothetical protein